MNKRLGTVGFIISERKILLARIQYPSMELWAGIGGMVEPDEHPDDALVREIAEETYIHVTKENIRKVKELEIDIRLFIYLIDRWEGELKIKDPTLKELKWFAFDKLPYSQMHDGTEEWLPELLEALS